MNVEIGTEATAFPEKEYIRFSLQCSAKVSNISVEDFAVAASNTRKYIFIRKLTPVPGTAIAGKSARFP